MGVLDKEGMIAAVIMGAVIVYFAGLNYLAFMFIFLFLGIIVTRYDYEIKRDMGLYEHERGVENVLSNGLGPMLFAIVAGVLGPVPFLASVAAVTADTFGSEVGVLARGKPLNLGNLQPAKAGTSGAISAMGTVASAIGAMLIAVAGLLIFNLNPNQAFWIGVAGFLGSFVDTLFGIVEEKGIGTKGTTNFICSIAGGIIGILIR